MRRISAIPYTRLNMGLDTVELVISVEKIFDLTIPDEIAGELDTVRKLHEFIVAELARLERPRIHADIIFDQLRVLICAQLGVTAYDVKPDAHFIYDLGAN